MINIELSPLVQLISSIGLSSTLIFSVLRFMGDKIFSRVISEKLKSEGYLNETELTLLVNSKVKQVVEDLLEEVDELIESNANKCKSESREDNDNRYLTRKEFQLYLDSQEKNNQNVERALSDVRNLCNQILMKMSDK